MIPAHIIRKIRRIHIRSARTVDSTMAGRYRSAFRGSGMEFESVREYIPGDDVRSIDWKVSARMGKPFVRLYREEREGIVMLLIDMSASLRFGTFFGPKIERVAEAASVLAFNAVKSNDKVGAAFFTDRVETHIPPKKGSSHIWRVISKIYTISPLGKGTDVAGALDYLARIARKRCFVFILSDFMDDKYLRHLRMVRRRHDVTGIMIRDKGDRMLPDRGILTLWDEETGRIAAVDGASIKTRERYAEMQDSARQRARDMFSSSGSDLVEMDTDAPVSDVLLRYFRQREKRFR